MKNLFKKMIDADIYKSSAEINKKLLITRINNALNHKISSNYYKGKTILSAFFSDPISFINNPEYLTRQEDIKEYNIVIGLLRKSILPRKKIIENLYEPTINIYISNYKSLSLTKDRDSKEEFKIPSNIITFNQFVLNFIKYKKAIKPKYQKNAREIYLSLTQTQKQDHKKIMDDYMKILQKLYNSKKWPNFELLTIDALKEILPKENLQKELKKTQKKEDQESQLILPGFL